MELEHIKLSDAMRQRLETALHKVNERDKSSDDIELQEAAAAALWDIKSWDKQIDIDPESEMAKYCKRQKKFGLDSDKHHLTEEKANELTKEASALSSVLIGMAGGTGKPAVLVGNLPRSEDHTLEDMAQRAIGLNLSTKCRKDYAPDGKKVANTTYYINRYAHSIISHSAKPLHSEHSGKASITPRVQALGGAEIGDPSLPTVVISVDEWIDDIAKKMGARKDHVPLMADWDDKKLRAAVIEALKAPIWRNDSVEYSTHKNEQNIRDANFKPATKLMDTLFLNDREKRGQLKQYINNSFIYENPNYKNPTDTPDCPQYGLLKNPMILVDTGMNNKDTCKASNSKLAELGIDRKFIKELAICATASLREYKPPNDRVVIQPGQILFFNDHMALHGAGHFALEEIEQIKNKELLGQPYTRYIISSEIPSGILTTKAEARLPGSVSLISPIDINERANRR